MGWWKDANEAEDPATLKQPVEIVKTLGKALRDERRESRERREQQKKH